MGKETDDGGLPTAVTLPEVYAPLRKGRRNTIPPAGSLIADTYRVLETLGDGGMGVVLLAQDERLDRKVAIKVVQTDMAVHREFQERFLTEARAMARVRHENVVTIYAFGEHDRAPYFVMEYVPGETVEHRIRKRNGEPLPRDQALSILEQVSRGVDAIHRSGAIHGDIKPSNILIGPAFRVAVADLGLALPLSELEGNDSLPIAGTPGYMAPERALAAVSAEYAPRCDVYSLGVLAFELLTGRVPFQGDNVRQVLYKQMHEPPPPPSELCEDLPAVFDEVIRGALDKDFMTRTTSAAEFRQALLAAQHDVTRMTKRIRVLVAEDDADFRVLSVRWLRRAFPGSEIVEVPDGTSALAQVEQSPFSLAVIDLHMPGLNGIQLTAAIRAAENGKDLPILVVTGQGGAPDWQVLSELGADGFLVKPVDATSLIMTARRIAGTAAA